MSNLWHMGHWKELLVTDKHNQEACFHLPGCTCLTHRPIWPARGEEEPQLWALQKSLFAHTVTPMSLTLNSCDLLPSHSQHSSPAALRCQDSEQANSNWLIYFLNHTQTNKQLWSRRWHTDSGSNKNCRRFSTGENAFFHFSILRNCLIREECPPLSKQRVD